MNIENVAEPSGPEGSQALKEYLTHGGGAELLRAYVQRREADKENTKTRWEELLGLISVPGTGLPPGQFYDVRREMLWLRILEELDPIIQDLLAFTESETHQDYQLSVMREALRINKGRSPYDNRLAVQRWDVERRWINAYLNMQETSQYRTENVIAKEIAKASGVSIGTASNHWKGLRQREPWQAEWADQVAGMARVPRKNASAAAGKIERTNRKNTAKVKSPRKKLNFGKFAK